MAILLVCILSGICFPDSKVSNWERLRHKNIILGPLYGKERQRASNFKNKDEKEAERIRNPLNTAQFLVVSNIGDRQYKEPQWGIIEHY